MRYDVIPEYKVIFNEDNFIYNNINIGPIAYALSYWGYLYTEKEVSNKAFFEESVGVFGIDKEKQVNYLKDKTLITELGVLRAWKSSFEKLCDEGLILHSLPNDFNYLYRLIVKEQECCVKLFEKSSIPNMLMTFSTLSYLDNINNEFFRTYFLFIKNKDLYTEKFKKQKYCEIFEKFEARYELSLYEYIQALYVITMCKCEANFRGLVEKKNLSHFNFLISANQINDNCTRKTVEKVLKILSFNYNEAHIWSCETKENTLDFNLFQEKPLYQITEEFYVPITRKYMQDQCFNSLVYKINSSYNENDLKFWNILGYLFEEYVKYIFEQTLDNAGFSYKLIPEFKYGSKKQKKDSPDLILVLDNNVCVFELKAARPLNTIFCYDNNMDLQKSIDKVIKAPINQCIKRTEEIVISKAHSCLTNEMNYYFIALTLGNFPDHYSDYSELTTRISQSSLSIKGLFNFSIEEFELLCQAVEQGKKNIIGFLEGYRQMPEHFSFKNYINQNIDKTIKPQFFQELENDIKMFTDNINL